MKTRIGLLAAAGLALAACGGGAASTAPTVSVAPSVAPSTAVEPSAAATPNLHGAADLEAALPDTIGGVPVLKFSFSIDELAASGGADQIGAIIQVAGGDPASVQLAMGNTGTNAQANVLALRADGVDGGKLVDAYQQVALEASESTSASRETIGGREVIRLKSPTSNPLGDLWIYAKGDTLFGVQSKDEDLAAELLAQLP